ncbi:MAG: lytic transglycosylase domain-containing protein [Myxococcaceae bacterium]|nr:lytic transglycosylase domain-containing protein [Myxococcaceae bacterium]
MRGLRAVTVGAVLFTAFAVGAYQRDRAPVCDLAPAPVPATPGPAEAELLRQIQDRDAEIARLKAAIAAREDAALYAEAEAKGVVEAVKKSGLPARQQRRIAVAIIREAHAHDIDPLLVVAVIRIESAFDNYAVSPVGAMGLMQLMPDTGRWLMQRRGEKLGRRTNLFDSELNIEMGTAYLAELIEQFGTLERALVAYNAGPGAAQKILKDKRARTKFLNGYPKKVMSELKRLQRAAQTRMAEQVEVPEPDGRG